MMEPLDVILEQETRDLLTGAIARLPDRERICLRMNLEGFSPEDTAACLATEHQEVRSALKRALTLLQRSICVTGRD